MASTSDIRNGLCIVFKNDLYQIIQFQHVKPGKGPAFVRTKLKNLTTGRVIDNTFSGGSKIDTVRVESRQYQYLYKDGDNYVFMHNETFEQVILEPHFIDNPQLMKEGTEVKIVFHAEEEKPITLELPIYVVQKLVYSEPGEKGNTASSTATKLARTETGFELQVPLFVSEGESVKISTEDGKYMERIKN